MPPRTKRSTRKSSTKAEAPKGSARKRGRAKAKPTPEPDTNGGRTTVADHVEEIIEMLQDGATMTEVRAEYGSGQAIRKALMEKGYNTKGEKVSVSRITGTGQALAKKVAAAREDGEAWYSLELRTGKSADELKDLLDDNGYGHLTEGRVVQEKDEPEAKPARSRRRKASGDKPKTGTGRKGKGRASRPRSRA